VNLNESCVTDAFLAESCLTEVQVLYLLSLKLNLNAFQTQMRFFFYCCFERTSIAVMNLNRPTNYDLFSSTSGSCFTARQSLYCPMHSSGCEDFSVEVRGKSGGRK
jgi:hypothetical protein